MSEENGTIHWRGNLQLLDLYKVAFLCSRRFPAAAALKAYRWAEEQRENCVCVISGYHSPIEKQVLHRLLKGTQPIIVVLAKGLRNLDPELKPHIEAGRLLIITRYAESVSHACEAKCRQRNRMMIGMADEIVIAHASAGGNLERLSRDCPAGKILKL